MRKEHLFIDLADLLVFNKKKLLEPSLLIKAHLIELTRKNPSIQIHVFYSENHLPPAPKPGDEMTFYIFDNENNRYSINNVEIVRLLMNIVQQPSFDATAVRFFSEMELPVLNHDDNPREWLKNSLLISSNNSILTKALCDSIKPNESFFRPPAIAQKTSFSINRRDFEALQRKISEEGKKTLLLTLDFDDTIIDFDETKRVREIVLIENTLNYIAKLLNGMDDISNVIFTILSARPDDAAAPPGRPDKIADTAPLFFAALNERIKEKHPHGASILSESIVCLQTHMNHPKEIVLAHKKGHYYTLASALLPANTPDTSLVAMLPPDDNDITTYDFKRISLSNFTKATYLNHILLPKMRTSLENEFIFAMFDDSKEQLNEIRKLSLEYPDRIFTVWVEKNDPIPALSANKSAFTSTMTARERSVANVMEAYKRERVAEQDSCFSFTPF